MAPKPVVKPKTQVRKKPVQSGATSKRNDKDGQAEEQAEAAPVAGTSTLRRNYSFEVDAQLALHGEPDDASLAFAADRAAMEALLASLYSRDGSASSCAPSDLNADEQTMLDGYDSETGGISGRLAAAALSDATSSHEYHQEEEWSDPDPRRLAETSQAAEIGQQQDERRAELRDYMDALKSRRAEDGTSLVQFPKEFHALVQKLLADKLDEYESMRGWLPGHARQPPEADTLSFASEDPRVREGLAQIQKLDEKLMAKAAHAAIVAREAFPERWQRQQDRKAVAEQRRLEDAIHRERRRQQRAARLQQALGDPSWASDDEAKENEDGCFSRQGLYASLAPEQEELVEAILAQDDAELMNNNPFEYTTAVEVEGVGPVSLAEIDSKLSQYLAEHQWDEQGNLADCRSASQLATDAAASNPTPPAIVIPASLTPCPNKLNLPATVSPALWRPAKDATSPSLAADRPGGMHSPANHAKPSSSIAQSSTSTNRGQPDYLREARMLRELAARGVELDAAIRALRTSELPPPLLPDQMAALVADCRRQLEALQASPAADGAQAELSA